MEKETSFKVFIIKQELSAILGMSTVDKKEEITYKKLIFSAGEVHIQMQPYIIKPSTGVTLKSKIVIAGRITSSEALIELLMLNDAIDRRYPDYEKHLDLFYTPFSRQDRVANVGEALSIKVFGNMINACNFKSVTTYDNHSSVSNAVINNCIERSQLDLFVQTFTLNPAGFNFIISPDAGANKKSFIIAKEFGIDMIQADKTRNTITGDITGTVVHAEFDKLVNKTVMIADDICDGGRTVIEIAKVLKEKGVNKIYCYFTHGIFSKGLDVLFDAGIDHIFTTDSFIQEENEKLTVLELG